MIDMKKLEEGLNNLPEEWIILVETGPENISDLNVAMLKILVGKNYTGIVLSASRPYSNLLMLYEKNSIDMEKIFVLDCISKKGSVDTKKTEEQPQTESQPQSQPQPELQPDKVLYLENVADLTNISLSIAELSKKIVGNKFVFIDSIDTMLIYNEPITFARFIHHILTTMRINGVSGLLISMGGDTNKEVRAEIAQLCDKAIKF